MATRVEIDRDPSISNKVREKGWVTWVETLPDDHNIFNAARDEDGYMDLDFSEIGNKQGESAAVRASDDRAGTKHILRRLIAAHKEAAAYKVGFADRIKNVREGLNAQVGHGSRVEPGG